MVSLALRPKLGALLLLAAVLASPAAADLKTSTSGLTFISVTGRSPEPQEFGAFADPPVSGFAPTVLASTQTGNWLAVSTATGGSFAGNVTVRVSVTSSSLPVGNYTGQITVTQSGLAGSPATVPVTLRVVPAAPYLSASPEILNIVARPGLDPAPASLTVINAGTGTTMPTFTATTSSGGNWLSVSQPIGGSFQSSSSVSVNVRSSTLSAGSYAGVITVASSGATNTPLNVPVNLTIGTTGGPTISLSPTAMAFLAGLGASPPPKNISINNAGSGTLRPMLAASTFDGRPWLRVSTGIGGSFGFALSAVVSTDITGLDKGTYNGTITVTDGGASNSPARMPVTLQVDDPKPQMQLTTYSMGFSAPTVGAFGFSRFVDVNNLGTGLLRWRATTTSEGPRQWLSVGPESGEDVISFVRVIVDTTGLPAGVYKGEVIFTAAYVAAGENPQKIMVTLGVGVPLASVNSSGVVNGASFGAAPVAAGSIVSIFGRDLGPREGVRAQLVGGKLPTALAGVRVFFAGVPAPLFYASSEQLNVQVPLEMADRQNVPVQVVVNDLAGEALLLRLRAADPGVFLVNGRPAIFHASSNTQVTANTQARAGDFLVIYATGLGALDTALETGAPAPVSALARTRTVPRVLLGGVAAPVLFSGLAPGFVGLYQVNIQVPAGVAAGNSTLILSLENAETAPLSVPVS